MGTGGKNQNEKMKQDRIHKFVGDQLSRWPLACANFRALKNVKVRELNAGGLTVKVQFNPARMISSAAKLNAEEIAARKCFLCRENRPPEQIMMKFEGRKGKKYHILVNPYPIFPDHLVIAADRHTDQSIKHRYVDMLDLARKYDGYTFFYNGPKSGASAPDHHHFQASPKGLIPLQNDVDELIGADSMQSPIRRLVSIQDAALYHYERFTKGVFVIRSQSSKSAAKLFYRLLDCMDIMDGDTEPLFNLFTYWSEGEFRSIVIFRSRHRSHHYFSIGDDHLTMSPGCADMGGVFIVPVEEEYDKLDEALLNEMIEEVSITGQMQSKIINRLTRTQPYLEVGIMSSREIVFEILSDGAGVRKAMLKEGKIEYDGILYDELFFEEKTLSSMFAEPSFILHDVTIGVDFHWERKEDQSFAGALKIIVEKDRLTAINIVGVEDYLLSVISSEMKAEASEEFLKAHAVISRSWVMARIRSSRSEKTTQIPEGVSDLPSIVTDLDGRICTGGNDSGSCHYEYVKWYDHDDHKAFDVCADDHCQRYQGLARVEGMTVRKVIDQTWGQVLQYEGELCDARFSKCCGGKMEVFSSCWKDEDKPYLQSLHDTPDHSPDGRPFCDTNDKEILLQVLNDYDLETEDFYRWETRYSRDEISRIIHNRSGINIGRLKSLEIIERGQSGRITRLRMTGDKSSLVVGKELEIRKLLSETHLKSSAFNIIYRDASGNILNPSDDWSLIVFEGAGWGHGVGLCQIGAAVMASMGYGYKEILEHYYPGAVVSLKHMGIYG